MCIRDRRNPRPTRAEVTDVANAVYDGTDAVMLSGETAQGKYPLEALQMMVHIVENTEEHLDYDMILRKAGEHRLKSASSALANATVTTANNLRAKCIVTPTVSGATARVVSKFKPKTGIIGISPDEATLRRMQINWGVMPVSYTHLTCFIQLYAVNRLILDLDTFHILASDIQDTIYIRFKEGCGIVMRNCLYLSFV